jgi:hypothetical protein
MGSHGPWDSHVAVDFPMNESPFRGSRAAKSRQLLEYFGVHGMIKELRHERQKGMRWSMLTNFLGEKGRSRFYK